MRVAIVGVLLLAGFAPGAAVADHGGDGAPCAFPYTATDATGTNVTVPEEPERVVVLGASAAQTAWEVGADEKVVGIDAFSTYLDGAENVTVVSQGVGAVNYEDALAQDPDLILVAGDSYADNVATEFRKSDVPVFKLPNAQSLDAVANNTRTVGHLLGACEGASDTVSWMTERVSVVRETVEGESEPSLFYDLGAGQGDVRYTAGQNTFIGAVVDAAGAANVVANGNFSSPYPTVANEFILEQDPEWVLVTYTPGSQYGPTNASAARQAVYGSAVLNQTTAAEREQVIAVNGNHLNQPAPRVVLALEALAAELHPEAYQQANATVTPTPTTTPTASGDSGGGVPGFGVPAALAAAAAAGVGTAARRRYQ
jgi:iron complex transport system substrate-binding protein